MKLLINSAVLERFPRAQIGYVLARVKVVKDHEHVNELITSLPGYLENILKINRQNHAEKPELKMWRDIYQEQFKVKPKTYKPSVLALTLNTLSKGYPSKVSSYVDLYNYISVKHQFPMGAYDLGKINGNIVIRYAEQAEHFTPLGGKDQPTLKPEHIVYADDDKVLCWLWNHKDSNFSYVDADTRYALLFIDSADTPTTSTVADAITEFSSELSLVGGEVLTHGILSSSQPEVTLDITTLIPDIEEQKLLQEKLAGVTSASNLAKAGVETQAAPVVSNVTPVKPSSTLTAPVNSTTLFKTSVPSTPLIERELHPTTQAYIDKATASELRSSLMNSAATGDLAYLRAATARLKTLDPEFEVWRIADDRKITIFMQAANSGKVAVADFLLQGCTESPINAVSEHGVTALYIAARNRSKEMYDYLLAHGADEQQPTPKHSTNSTIAEYARAQFEQTNANKVTL